MSGVGDSLGSSIPRTDYRCAELDRMFEGKGAERQGRVFQHHPSLAELVRSMVADELDRRVEEMAMPGYRYRPTVHLCIELAAREFNVSSGDIRSESKLAIHVRPRHAAMWLAQKVTGQSYPVIGRQFNRDHSSTHHGVQRAEQLRQEDGDFADSTTRMLAYFVGGM